LRSGAARLAFHRQAARRSDVTAGGRSVLGALPAAMLGVGRRDEGQPRRLVTSAIAILLIVLFTVMY
jgi:hypothetical protein